MKKYNSIFKERKVRRTFRESSSSELKDMFSIKLNNSLLSYNELKNIIAWVDLIGSYGLDAILRKMYSSYRYGLEEVVSQYCTGMNWSMKDIDPGFEIDDVFYQRYIKLEVTYFAADDEVIKLNAKTQHQCQYSNLIGGEFSTPNEKEKVIVPHSFEFVWRDVPKIL